MEITTMILFLAIIYLAQGLVLALQFRVNKQFKGVGWWLLWSLSEALGFFFMTFRNLDNPVLMFFQNVFLFYGTMFVYIGVRKFFGKKLNRPVLGSVFIGFALLQVFFLTLHDSVEARTTLVYISASMVAVVTGWSLFTDRPDSIRLSANFTAVVFSLHALFILFTGILKFTGTISSHPLSTTPLNYLTFIDALLLGLLCTFSLIIMLNQRLNASLKTTIQDLRVAEASIRSHLTELEKSNSEKDTFYSVLAHDLRSPMNSLLGFTQLMDEEYDTLEAGDIPKINKAVHQSAEKLYSLVENLLEWSRAKRGLIPVDAEAVDLGAEAELVLQPVAGLAGAKSIRITNRIRGPLPALADRHMLETILRNLLVNSVKFTPEGGEVTLAAGPDLDGMVLIKVTDTGIGMDPILASNVFSLDSKSTRKGTAGEPGSGLGLVICREFVQKMGGRIWLESEEGKGSTFCFTLPSVAGTPLAKA